MLDCAIVVTRLLLLASAALLCGSPLFYLYALDAPRTAAAAWPRGLLLASNIVGLAAMIGWLMAETVALTGEPHDALRWSALASVVSETRFGTLAALRVIWLALSTTVALIGLPSRRLWLIQGLLGSVLLASFAWSGHGNLNQGAAAVLHLAGDVSHLLAAGIWIGALLPLSIVLLRSLQPDSDARGTMLAIERFSTIGILLVGLLILSGLINSWYLIGPAHWRELYRSDYGRLLLLKLALFASMLGFASSNRWRWLPRLQRTATDRNLPTPALRQLCINVLCESALALLVFAAVALLGTLSPPVSN